MNLLIDSYFLSVVSLLSRVWIVPVGGSTPDRLEALLRPSRAGRGLHPRPERSIPAKHPPIEYWFAIPNSEINLAWREFCAIIPPVTIISSGARLSGGPLNKTPDNGGA